jgi:hypothetical protein
MKRGFVRCLWGVPSKMYRRNSKVINLDLEFIKYNPFDQPFTTYVFGESNYELLQSHGIKDCKLITKLPGMYDRATVKQEGIDQYGHKLKVIEEASKDFDEFIFLDWDCMAVRPLPANFWEGFYAKQSVQAHLRSYGFKQKYILKKGAIWRDVDVNKRPCASFVYIRGREIAEKIYNTWLEDKKRSDEKVLAMVTDEIIGGWDIKKYWDNFEANHFTLYKDALRTFCYSREALSKKESTFLHLNRYTIADLIKKAKVSDNIEEQRRIVGDLLTERINNLHGGLIRSK